MTGRKKTQRRITGFNGLRTLALLGVLLYHTFPAVMKGGYFGVIIFFVISGFLTAYSTVTKGRFRIGSYYAKRLLRIYPALLIVLFAAIGAITLKDPSRLSNTQQEVISVLLGYNNYWQISANADYFANLANQSPFTHLWYIAILLQFELIWPLLYQLTYRSQKTAPVLFGLTVIGMLVMPVILIVKPESSLTALYYGTHTRIFSLFAGALLGFLQGKGRLRNPLRRIGSVIPVTIYLVITAVIFLTARGTGKGVYLYGMQLYTLLTCLIVLVLSSGRTKAGSLLDNNLTAFFSKYSYEIYLWQYPVMFVIGLFNIGTAGLILQIPLILILSIWLNNLLSFRSKR